MLSVSVIRNTVWTGFLNPKTKFYNFFRTPTQKVAFLFQFPKLGLWLLNARYSNPNIDIWYPIVLGSNIHIQEIWRLKIRMLELCVKSQFKALVSYFFMVLESYFWPLKFYLFRLLESHFWILMTYFFIVVESYFWTLELHLFRAMESYFWTLVYYFLSIFRVLESHF